MICKILFYAILGIVDIIGVLFIVQFIYGIIASVIDRR